MIEFKEIENGTPTNGTPTPADVEKLKTEWCRDPCWDLANTEGFEHYHNELVLFQMHKEKEWQQKRDKRLKKGRQKWFELNLNDSFCPEKHITITRVPGGWVMESGLRDTVAMTFIPYSDEFKGE